LQCLCQSLPGKRYRNEGKIGYDFSSEMINRPYRDKGIFEGLRRK
jgi:hypothetical protein